MSRRGFTLVEVVLIVVILGVISAILILEYQDHAERARASAAATIVHTVRSRIAQHCTEDQAPPAAILDSWFGGPVQSPWYEPHESPIHYWYSPLQRYPIFKVSTSGALAFWYNGANGQFHARVPAQDTDAETLELFNKVNGTDLNSLFDVN